MVLFDGTLNLAVGLLAIVALAEMGKYRQHHQRPFRVLGSAGFFLAASAVFGLPDVLYLGINASLSNLFLLLGEIATLVAVVLLGWEVLMEWSGKKNFKL